MGIAAGECKNSVRAVRAAGDSKAPIMYVPDGTERRKQTARGVVVGVSATVIWLLVYWNVYYRALVPIYARRREQRRRRRFEQYSMR